MFSGQQSPSTTVFLVHTVILRENYQNKFLAKQSSVFSHRLLHKSESENSKTCQEKAQTVCLNTPPAAMAPSYPDYKYL